MLLRNRLESGDIFCCESVKYQSFEDDLIDKWNGDLINDIGLTKLNYSIEKRLSELEKRILEVNKRIDNGDNEHIEVKKIGKNTKWTLKYPSGTEATNHNFFNEISTKILYLIHLYT